MATPFFYVNRKDAKLQPCQDYKYLNEWTIKNTYPLPLVTDLLDKLKKAKFFTKLDIQAGYNNIQIRDCDRWKAVFKIKYGLYKPMVMFFVPCNSPVTFQNMMDHIFMDYIDEDWLIDFINDLLIFAETKEQLKDQTLKVLKQLKENDLFLKPEKAEFCQTRIYFLGMIIEQGKISMDPTKLNGIRDWPAPTSLKEVQQFLGFGNFYRKFIWKYLHIIRPLNDLLKKMSLFNLSPKCQMN